MIKKAVSTFFQKIRKFSQAHSFIKPSEKFKKSKDRTLADLKKKPESKTIGKIVSAKAKTSKADSADDKKSLVKPLGTPPYVKNRKKTSSKKTPNRIKKTDTHKSWQVSQFTVEPVDGKSRFHDFDLPGRVMHAVFDLKFKYCTPIQSEVLSSTLAGRDVLGQAQTGTGKTAAFLITVISRMLRHPVGKKRKPGTPRTLILAPTRELVMQIADEAKDLSKYCNLKTVSVFGGMDYEKQRRRLSSKEVDIVVATPGRLLDFKRKGEVNLGKIETLIIDEADRMLDMGFIPDVRQIIYSTPPKAKRQTLLFSATLTEDVTRLVSQWTTNPLKVEIEPEQIAVDTVKQVVYIVTTRQKSALLYNIITKQKLKRVLIFCNRRDETSKLTDFLLRYKINCDMLSGAIRQTKRVKILEKFKAGKVQVLVATDVAGRGIHIEGMSHVINYTLPHDPENYVHRIGRTGRAGESGTSISFACEEDSFYLPDIEKFIGRPLSCQQPDEKMLKLPPLPKSRTRPKRKKPDKRSNYNKYNKNRPKKTKNQYQKKLPQNIVILQKKQNKNRNIKEFE